MLLLGQSTFQEKSQEVGINHYFHNGNLMGGGVAVFDYNNDGWEDLWINGGNHRDVLYQNAGNGTFEEIGGPAGLAITEAYRTTGVVTGDIDNDGLRDVFITTRENTANILLKNMGDGTFRNITETAGLNPYIAWSTTAGFADVNLDGYLDLYVGNYVEDFDYIVDSEEQILIGYNHTCQPNFLFLNNQDGTFSEIGNATFTADQGCALASVFTDFDQDGDVDLMVANDYGQWVLPNNLLVNQQIESGRQAFKSISDTVAKVGIYAMGIAIGDYDQDQDLDYYITNLGRNSLLENQGNELFQDKSQLAGVEDTFADSDLTVGWGTTFLDVDNDMDLDLFVANGFISALSFNRTSLQNKDRIFINHGYSDEKGGVFFSEESDQCGVGDASTARGLATGDFDNDGDVDVVIVRVSGTSDPTYRKNILYYENQLDNGHNWLKVRLASLNNKDAYGSQIRIVVNGKSWLTEINGGSSHASQNSSINHFGLGEATIVDSLIVQFLGGKQTILTNISANQMLVVEEASALSTSIHEETILNSFNLKASPNPSSTFFNISFDNPNSAEFSIKIYDTLGQLIDSKSTNNSSYSIQNEQLKKGFYFIHLQKEDGRTVILKVLRI